MCLERVVANFLFVVEGGGLRGRRYSDFHRCGRQAYVRVIYVPRLFFTMPEIEGGGRSGFFFFF